MARKWAIGCGLYFHKYWAWENLELQKKYEIANIEEAEHYLMDELLSKRLLELTNVLVYEVEGRTAEEIFGFPDYLKFHSSMTLFIQ